MTGNCGTARGSVLLTCAIGAAMLSGITMSAMCARAAEGDAAKGMAIFVRQCALCHTIAEGGRNGFGPNLFGVIKRKAASAPGYQYSPAFKTIANWTWSPDGVRSFLISPTNTIPGNKMAVFQGVADSDLDDLIAYLAAQK